MSHDTSVMISFPRSISDSLIVVYSSGVVVVPKCKHRQRKDGLTTIVMHVEVFCRYATSRSDFPVRMRFEGRLMRMAAIMWSILRRQKPYKHVWRVSFSAQLFTERYKGPVKDQLWETYILV